MAENDNYYRRRIEEELAAAEIAGDVAVSQIHHELARRYRDKIDGELPPEMEAAAVRPEASLSAAVL